jgi:hypothetical protein
MIDASSWSMPASGYNWPRRLNVKPLLRPSHSIGAKGAKKGDQRSRARNVIPPRIAKNVSRKTVEKLEEEIECLFKLSTELW